MAYSRRRVIGHLVAGLAASAARPAFSEKLGSAASRPSGNTVVDTRWGKVRGVETDGVSVFRGVPYGASTAGAARFLPPRQPAPWRGVRDALDCGPPCVQVNTDLPAWVDPRAASEDCLCLNVWTPRPRATEKLAVMVWIHGGAYVSGSGGLALYDGSNLARHGNVVVVSVNHRLGALGYLYLTDLDPRYPDSGNAGQLDLIAALEWVRDNVEHFGGNSANVTVFGESGGGGKITTLCQMPAAQGLYHKAIIQSGSLWDTHEPRAAARICANLLAQPALGGHDFTHLLQIAPERLVSAAENVSKRGGSLPFRPVLDGRSIVHNSWATAAPPGVKHVPMLIGTNSDEAAYFVKDPIKEPADDNELVARLVDAGARMNLTSRQARAFIEQYRAIDGVQSRLQLLIAISTDFFLWRNAISQAEHKVQQAGAPVYMYEFSWKTPCFGRQWTPHGSEIPFVFGNLDYKYAWDENDTPAVRAAADPKGRRFQLADSMMQAWAEFARSGNPSVPTLPPWPAYGMQARNTMILGDQSRIVADPRSEQRKILRQLLG